MASSHELLVKSDIWAAAWNNLTTLVTQCSRMMLFQFASILHLKTNDYVLSSREIVRRLSKSFTQIGDEASAKGFDEAFAVTLCGSFQLATSKQLQQFVKSAEEDLGKDTQRTADEINVAERVLKEIRSICVSLDTVTPRELEESPQVRRRSRIDEVKDLEASSSRPQSPWSRPPSTVSFVSRSSTPPTEAELCSDSDLDSLSQAEGEIGCCNSTVPVLCKDQASLVDSLRVLLDTLEKQARVVSTFLKLEFQSILPDFYAISCPQVLPSLLILRCAYNYNCTSCRSTEHITLRSKDSSFQIHSCLKCMVGRIVRDVIKLSNQISSLHLSVEEVVALEKYTFLHPKFLKDYRKRQSLESLQRHSSSTLDLSRSKERSDKIMKIHIALLNMRFRVSDCLYHAIADEELRGLRSRFEKLQKVLHVANYFKCKFSCNEADN